MADLETIEIDVSNELLAAMAFLAVLAYPESHEKRDRAVLAMQALMIRGLRSLGHHEQPSNASDILAAMPVQQQQGTLRLLTRRLNKRLEAGRAAAMLIAGFRKPGPKKRVSPVDQKHTRDGLMSAGATMDRAGKLAMKVRTLPGEALSLNDFARAAGRTGFYREWRRDVIHLCLVMHDVRVSWRDPRAAELKDQIAALQGFSVARLLANPGWAVRAIESAEHLASILRLESLIRLVPVRDC